MIALLCTKCRYRPVIDSEDLCTKCLAEDTGIIKTEEERVVEDMASILDDKEIQKTLNEMAGK